MNFTAVIMVKNEIDVIVDCCSHLFALFDDVVIIDHRSTDGTKECLLDLSNNETKLHLYHFLEKGYYQSELMTWIVKNNKSCRDADWVFLIDADEVLPFKSRNEFETALKKHADNPIIKMSWKNLVPIDYSLNSIMGREYLEPPSSMVYHKVAFQPSLIPVSDYVVAQGNHAILASSQGKQLPSVDTFNLYHVPIRSSDQLNFKVNQGAAAYLAMGAARDKSLGSHWFNISKYIEQNGISSEFMNGLSLNYGEPIDVKTVKLTYDEMITKGCKKIKLDFAFQDLSEVEFKLKNADQSENIALDMEVSDLEDVSDLTLIANDRNELTFTGSMSMTSYLTLGDKEITTITDDDLEFMVNFLEPATTKIQSMTPTAWGGHIPFLFCTVALIKPRMYAELGSHFGASFFATCQALQVNKIDGKAVAIDLWQGDEHAGFYGETVFNKFKYILNQRYTDKGEYLRMLFDDAADKFENGSIDLLHIDGLHTYEAVKNDYETWREKVVENGIILFHDTNVYEREFGVWKLWKEISGDAESFEFKHTHGLGVLAFGTPESNPLVRVLKIVNSSDVYANYFESFFSRVGQLTTDEALAEARSNIDTNRPLGALFSKLRKLKNIIRTKLVHIVKSVPFLRKIAYSILRVVRG